MPTAKKTPADKTDDAPSETPAVAEPGKDAEVVTEPTVAELMARIDKMEAERAATGPGPAQTVEDNFLIETRGDYLERTRANA